MPTPKQQGSLATGPLATPATRRADDEGAGGRSPPRNDAEPFRPPVPSQDELNLAEFPFCLLTSRSYRGRNTITIEREVHDREGGGMVRQEWTATGSEKHGLPTARDMDVYVALMQIAARDGIDKDRRIHFSRLELVIMQGRTPCQPTYEQLERSLERLHGVRIITKDAFFDASTRRRRTVHGFGIIDSFKLEDCRVRVREPGKEGGGAGEGEQLELRFHRSWVSLNEALYDQVRRGGIKNLDTETYYSLDYPVSRRLFRFLDRVREKNQNRYEIELALLARLMPLHDPRASRQLRDLTKAHQELVKAGYLEKVEPVDGKDGIRLVYGFPEPRLEPRARLLVERGVSAGVARALVERFPDRIERQVEAFDRLVRDAKIARNPAGYLRRSIEEDWRGPPPRAERGEAGRGRAARSVDLAARRSRGLAQLYASLDAETRREIDERARAAARREVGEAASGRRLELEAARKREEILLAEFDCEIPG